MNKQSIFTLGIQRTECFFLRSIRLRYNNKHVYTIKKVGELFERNY